MPLHRKQNLVSAMLSKELKDKFKKNSMPLRKGDEVKVLRGDFKGTTGEVSRIDLKNSKIYVTSVTSTKVDGTSVERPVRASNLMITNLDLEDQKRRNMLEKSGVEE